MQFGFMPGKGTTDALFILRRMQEEFRGREKKLYMCFVEERKSCTCVLWTCKKRLIGFPEK